jgi:hypothetical protein
VAALGGWLRIEATISGGAAATLIKLGGANLNLFAENSYQG